MSARGRFPHLMKGVLFCSPTNVGHHNPPPFGAQHPRQNSFLSPIDVGSLPNPPSVGPSVVTGTPCLLWGTASLVANSSVSGSNTICNGPDPLLADNVLFWFSLSSFPSKL